jgi:protein translocation Sec62 family protein
VTKIDGDAPGHEGHNHGKKKRVKGLWDVKIEQHQEAHDDNYYIWLYEGSQWKMKLYAVGALFMVVAIILFPLWPLVLRQGVWYVSMGMLGLIGLFFAMAIVRLILFIITMFTVSPGLWLYPNLFEDVGFFDSFRPVWAWHEVCQDELTTFLTMRLTHFSRPPKISRTRNAPRRRRRLPNSRRRTMSMVTRTRRTRKAVFHPCPKMPSRSQRRLRYKSKNPQPTSTRRHNPQDRRQRPRMQTRSSNEHRNERL